MMMAKKHWLYSVELKVDIEEETKCGDCIHYKVCSHAMEERCSNYRFGRSDETHCQSCTNHYARFDKDKVPCFHCGDFLKGEDE